MSGVILPPFIGSPASTPASSSLLVYDEIWVREPRLMVPRQRPLLSANLKAKRSVIGGGTLKSLLFRKYDTALGGMWTGDITERPDVVYAGVNATIYAPKTFTLSSVNGGLALLFRMRPSNVMNYVPNISTGPWSGDYVIHAEQNGGCYAGWDSSNRITPSDTGNWFFSPAEFNDYAIWYGVHEYGVNYGIRLYKNSSLVLHKAFGSATYPKQSPGALSIATNGICYIEYMAAIDFGEHFWGTGNDANFTEIVRMIQSDPYNNLLELT